MTPLLVTVFDRLHARFFDVDDAGARELTSLASPGMRGGRFHSDRQGSPGWGERGYQQRVREETARHFRAVAQRLASLERRGPTRAVFLAAPGNLAITFQRSLPAPIAGKVIATGRLNPTEVTPAAVHRAVRAARARPEQSAERALVAQLQDGLGTGRAVTGVRETLRALANQQVRTLLVRPDATGAGYRCGASGRLVPSRADCRGEGAPIPVLDLFRAAARAARRQRAAVVTVRDPASAQAIDGLAALLRFR